MNANSQALGEIASSGSLSRREFLERAGVAGISIGLAGKLMTGASFAADTPRKGGHLVLGMGEAESSNSLDPALLSTTYPSILASQIYDTLTEIGTSGKISPRLAESWEAKRDAKEWVFKLRRGVTFHNGKTLTAADVVYSLNHHRGADSKSAAKSLLDGVDEIVASDTDEVTFKLNGGNAELTYLLSDYHFQIVPEGSNFTDGIGTGTFILESFQPGVRALTKLNPNKWNPDRGFVDSVESLAINDTTARLNALISGSVHIITQVDPKTASVIQSRPDLTLAQMAGTRHYGFPMDCQIAPFNNPDFRKAMKFATDREAIFKSISFGLGKIGNDQPIGEFDPNFNSHLEQHIYDVEKAKFHLKKSGQDSKVVLTISDAAFPGAVDSAQILQAGMAKAGIDLKIDRVSSDGYWSDVWLKAPMCATYWEGRPNADQQLTLFYQSKSAWNECRWNEPKFDQLLVDARSELDETKRKEMYGECQRLIHEDAGVIIPVFNSTIDAHSNKVKGFEQLPVRQLSGFYGPEKVWLDENA